MTTSGLDHLPADLLNVLPSYSLAIHQPFDRARPTQLKQGAVLYLFGADHMKQQNAHRTGIYEHGVRKLDPGQQNPLSVVGDKDFVFEHPILVISRPCNEPGVIHFCSMTSFGGRTVQEQFKGNRQLESQFYLALQRVHPIITHLTLNYARGAIARKSGYVRTDTVYSASIANVVRFHNGKKPEDQMNSDAWDLDEASLNCVLWFVQQHTGYVPTTQHKLTEMEQLQSHNIFLEHVLWAVRQREQMTKTALNKTQLDHIFGGDDEAAVPSPTEALYDMTDVEGQRITVRLPLASTSVVEYVSSSRENSSAHGGERYVIPRRGQHTAAADTIMPDARTADGAETNESKHATASTNDSRFVAGHVASSAHAVSTTAAEPRRPGSSTLASYDEILEPILAEHDGSYLVRLGAHYTALSGGFRIPRREDFIVDNTTVAFMPRAMGEVNKEHQYKAFSNIIYAVTTRSGQLPYNFTRPLWMVNVSFTIEHYYEPHRMKGKLFPTSDSEMVVFITRNLAVDGSSLAFAIPSSGISSIDCSGSDYVLRTDGIDISFKFAGNRSEKVATSVIGGLQDMVGRYSLTGPREE
ncbi:uncharacterized protein CLAFUR5_13984 [Fulvia fulva]|uniref:Uncharacterized protein n=1 Tax=Passalora fulva TaxID=5499 RepID=A0A9Q8PKY5_PASFU|nr:uncharacterized protein CLAFUR5_13984 [Fulvia fulva]KAK4611349.1 hypothetical protein CLAFUR0_14157 [Fulvia fulva]UJO24378.1 hypothetical protein CLAFUR5_13984 [Fulvia fulva]